MPLLAPGELADGYPAGTVLAEWPVDLGDVRLGRVDEYGGQWVVTEFAGRGSAPAQVEVNQRTGAHGAWVGGRWYAAKPYTLDVAYSGETAADRFAAEQRLLAAADVEDTVLVMHDEVPRTATVFLNGEVTIEPVGVYAFTAQVPLMAADPFRYALEPYTATTGLPTAGAGGLQWPATWPATWGATAASGSLLVDNAGSAVSYPVFRVYGPLADFTLSHPATGASMRVDLAAAGATLVEGEWLEVNMHSQQILLLGQSSRRRALAAGDFFGLPPGANEILFASSSYNGTAFVRVTGYSTWR